MDEKKELAKKLFECGAVKFGLFTFKSGIKSPTYVDLRVLVSQPSTLRLVARLLKEKAATLQFDRIAGIPYAAIAIATALSLESDWPMIYTRKEAKDYGTKKMIEGEYQQGDRVMVVDDLISNGLSKFEVINLLEQAGLKVKDVLVLVDNEQGGKKELEAKGYQLHAVMGLTEIYSALKELGLVTQQQYDENLIYLSNPKKWSEGK